MKKTFLLIALLAATATAVPALAAPGRCADCDVPCERMGRPDGEMAADDDAPGERLLQRMTRVLDLSAAQQEKIRAMIDAEQEQAVARRAQQREYREQLRQAEQKVPFDEGAIRAIAAKKAALKTEQIVSRAKVRSQIDAILTPEQRQLAERLRPEPGEGREGRRGPRPGGPRN